MIFFFLSWYHETEECPNHGNKRGRGIPRPQLQMRSDTRTPRLSHCSQKAFWFRRKKISGPLATFLRVKLDKRKNMFLVRRGSSSFRSSPTTENWREFIATVGWRTRDVCSFVLEASILSCREKIRMVRFSGYVRMALLKLPYHAYPASFNWICEAQISAMGGVYSFALSEFDTCENWGLESNAKNQLQTIERFVLFLFYGHGWNGTLTKHSPL